MASETTFLPGSYTATVQKVVAAAQQHARDRQADTVEPEHLLLALLDVKRSNPALQILAALHIDTDALQTALEQRLPTPQEAGTTTELPPLGAASTQTLRDATRESRNLGHTQTNTSHLLLALLYTERGLTHQVLDAAGLALYDLRQHILQHPRVAGTRGVPGSGLALLPSRSFLVLLGLMIGSGIGLNIGGGPAFLTSMTILFVISGWIVTVCIHEFGHALMAYYGGDYSVRDSGYLTLDPARYTHTAFSIVLPVVFLLLGGLGLPGGAVYINTRALRSKKWISLVALAGPLGTTFCELLIVLPFLLGLVRYTPVQSLPFWSALAFLGFLQITAVLFNLIPIPPLDGFGILEPFLPPDVAEQTRRYSTLLFLLLLAMLWFETPISNAFWDEAYRLSYTVGLPFDLVFAGIDRFLAWRP